MVSNKQLGAIGETAVMLELLKMGFDVININNSYNNYRKADLICMNPNNEKSVKIQVKNCFSPPRCIISGCSMI